MLRAWHTAIRCRGVTGGGAHPSEGVRDGRGRFTCESLIAGASGAVGSRLVPVLVAAGHEVVGTSRSAEHLAAIEAAGARGVVMDGLDAASVRTAVLDARPDAIVHELSALGGVAPDLKHFDEQFAGTNALRTRGTDNLLAAAREAGVGRFVAQSFTGWPNERSGGPVKTEDDPIDPTPTAASRQTIAAIRYVEQATTDAGGLALRYGGLYGPGNVIGRGGELLEMVKARQAPARRATARGCGRSATSTTRHPPPRSP